MKNKTGFAAIVILLGVILASSFASADLVMPGEKGISHCFEISNMDDYSDYTFFLIEMPGGWSDYALNDSNPRTIRVINPGECFSFYKLAEAKVFAVKGNITATSYESGMMRMINMSKIDSADLYESDLTLSGGGGQTFIINPVSEVKEILRIDSISANKLALVKEKTVRNYSALWLAVDFAIIALIAIILIIVLRKKKNTR